MIKVLQPGGLGRMEGSKTEQDREEIKERHRKIQRMMEWIVIKRHGI